MADPNAIQQLLDTLYNTTAAPSRATVQQLAPSTKHHDYKITPLLLIQLGNALQKRPHIHETLKRLRQEQTHRVEQWQRERKSITSTAEERILKALEAELPDSVLQDIVIKSEGKLKDLDKQLSLDFETLAERQQVALQRDRVPGFERTSRLPERLKFMHKVLDIIALVDE